MRNKIRDVEKRTLYNEAFGLFMACSDFVPEAYLFGEQGERYRDICDEEKSELK